MESTAMKVAAAGIAQVRAARIRMFLASTVGKKIVMALTGIVLVVFVIGHMVGNLQVFLGPESLNAYAELLRELGHGGLLWVVRGVLLAAVGLHVWAATALTLGSWAARPVGYRRRQRWTDSTYASRTMRWSGPILLIFIVYHLLHLTTGTAHGSFVPGDVYQNVISGFSVWPVAAFYIFAQLALGLHLYHGIWSMLQSLGLSHPSYNGLRFGVSLLLTFVVVAGNISIPIAVLTGIVH